jgi:hypothetical protein
MDARSIEPITLTPEQTATHTLKTLWHDDAKTQRKAEWVVRTRDNVGDGRVVWYHLSDGVRQAGQVVDGVLVGAWSSFDEAGRLKKVEDFRGDAVRVQQFVAETSLLYREGVRRKDGAGQWRDDGVWRFYTDGKVDYEDL